jgi:hypothetical protein
MFQKLDLFPFSGERGRDLLCWIVGGFEGLQSAVNETFRKFVTICKKSLRRPLLHGVRLVSL